MLNLGTQTASVTNHLMSRGINGAPEPEVGMGATLLKWTDRKAATVVSWDGTTLVVQEDTATRTDDNGMSEMQDYHYRANPNGSMTSYRRDKNGFWKAGRINPKTNRWKQTGGDGLQIGVRRAYHDFSF